MTAGRGRRPWLALATAMLAAGGCSTTVDSLGYNGPDGIVLHKLMPLPTPYPNPFRDLLGKTDADISAKIDAAYAQLFHGDPNTQAIYFPVGTDQAFIKDILHNDVRTEGVGYAMLISVERDKRDEFDRLWTYAKATMKITAGAATGYFNSSCDTTAGPTPCQDPFGMQQFLMSLLLARDRWDTTGSGTYDSDIKNLLTVMRHKQDENGGVVDGVTDVFDARAKLPVDQPDVKLANQGRPSIAMPAYYDLWKEATDDPFWSGAAASARAYLQRATNTMTGLSPVKERFDGTAVPGSDMFASESFRTLLNLALDCVWSEGSHCDVATSNLLIRFFTAQGDRYGSSFTLDGTTVLDPTHDDSLTAANGAAALVATANERVPFVNAVWSLATPSGLPRYYSGLLYLLSLLVLGGQLQVY